MTLDLDAGDLDRHLDLASAFNVRDLGGYPTADGRSVRWRTLFRADGLQRLEQPDLEVLSGHGLRTVIDLRTAGEIEERGRFPVDHLPVGYHHLPMIETLWTAEDIGTAASAEEFLVERYLLMLDEGAPSVRAVLELLASPDGTPAVFHCAAGKDRTGVLAALLLRVLGVDVDAVAADYALSAEAMRRLAERWGAEEPDAMARQPKAFMDAPIDAMHGFLDAVDRLHGSVEGYVRGLGVADDTVEALRDRLLA